MSTDPMKGAALYQKLWQCLKISMTPPPTEKDKDLSNNANNVIVALSYCIKSHKAWYDSVTDTWCDFFIKRNGWRISDEPSHGETEQSEPSLDDDFGDR